MSYSIKSRVGALAAKEYKPGVKLKDQIGAFLTAFANEFSVSQICADVNQFGCVLTNGKVDVFLGRNGSENSEHITHRENRTRPNQSVSASITGIGKKSAESDLSLPILYQDASMGCLTCRDPDAQEQNKKLGELLRYLGREIAFHAMRHVVAMRVKERFDREFLFIGSSDRFREMEVQIERSAKVDLPTVLFGEYGLEYLQIARALHFSSLRQQGPFIEINCAASGPGWEESDPRVWLAEANEGTLFLNNIDQLESTLQNQLAVLLEMTDCQWNSGRCAHPGKPDVRVIAAVSQDLGVLKNDVEFSRQLLAEIDFLEIPVPPLRDRGDDVRAYIEHFFLRYKQYDDQTLSHEVWKALQEYEWPGNILEVERLVARLLVRSGRREVGLGELEIIAPFVFGCGDNETTIHQTDGHSIHSDYVRVEEESRLSDWPDGSYEQSVGSMDLETLSGFVLTRNLESLRSIHPCMLKALEFIGEQYNQEITLAELAKAACVSPSHLCFLFRSELGTTFKTLLSMIRIEQAKSMLVSRPELAITTISLDVGFRDLSHFERTFRRLVSLNPRDYRRRNQAYSNGYVAVS